MARSPHSVTLAQIKLEQEYDEAQVRAQSALIGERAVAIVRLVMMAMIGISTGLVRRLTDEPEVLHPARGWVVGLYLAFSVITVIATQRVKKGNPKLALWLVGSYIFIDAGFFLAHAFIDHQLGQPSRPEIVTISFALLVCFSVARSRLIHVVLSTVVSVVSVAAVAR